MTGTRVMLWIYVVVIAAGLIVAIGLGLLGR
ncbi:MAG: hypothetical protein JWN65_3771 [Solirubrobacterales bacterium]|jgi:hypothetical protein|nr:hypothetical protein [Solirubrobacterales bacterium]